MRSRGKTARFIAADYKGNSQSGTRKEVGVWRNSAGFIVEFWHGSIDNGILLNEYRGLTLLQVRKLLASWGANTALAKKISGQIEYRSMTMESGTPTAAQLKRLHEYHNPKSYFFSRKSMRFFGDTMSNFGVRNFKLPSGDVFLLYRKYATYPNRYVEMKAGTGYLFDKKTFDKIGSYGNER